MKKLIYSILASVIVTGASAQQLTFESQYMLNQYLINPAAAGSVEELPIGLSFRQQWAGFNDAPRTQSLNGQYKLDNKRVGLGAIFTNDITGPLRRTQAQLTYAYHLPLENNTNLSFGLSTVFSHFTLDQSEFVMTDQNDQLINGSRQSTFAPDANFGVYYYSDKFYAGIAIPQLFQNKLKIGNMLIEDNRLKRHYFLSGGYRFELSDDLMLEPSALIKATPAAPVQFELSSRIHYQDFIWGGLSYRNSESLVALMGMKKGDFLIGYSYDFTLSNIRHYSAGTHELYLQYTLNLGNIAKASM